MFWFQKQITKLFHLLNKDFFVLWIMLSQKLEYLTVNTKLWRRGVMVTTFAQFRPCKPGPTSCAGSYHACMYCRMTMVRISNNGPYLK